MLRQDFSWLLPLSGIHWKKLDQSIIWDVCLWKEGMGCPKTVGLTSSCGWPRKTGIVKRSDTWSPVTTVWRRACAAVTVRQVWNGRIFCRRRILACWKQFVLSSRKRESPFLLLPGFVWSDSWFQRCGGRIQAKIACFTILFRWKNRKFPVYRPIGSRLGQKRRLF